MINFYKIREGRREYVANSIIKFYEASTNLPCLGQDWNACKGCIFMINHKCIQNTIREVYEKEYEESKKYLECLE